MPVKSLSKHLDYIVENSLLQEFESDQRDDSDLTVFWATSFEREVQECEHGDVWVENIFRVTVGICRYEGGEYAVSGSVSADLLMSGDAHPVILMMEEVCERLRFGLVMVETGQQPEEMVDSDDGES